MTDQARQHLKKEIMIGGGSNMVFNGLIAWLLLRGGEPLGWSGSGNFVGDVIATAFILPFIVALIVIPIHKRKLEKGKIEHMDFGKTSTLHSWVNRLPASTAGNAFWFGIAGMCIFAPLALLTFLIAGVEQFTPLIRDLQGCMGGRHGRCTGSPHGDVRAAPDVAPGRSLRN